MLKFAVCFNMLVLSQKRILKQQFFSIISSMPSLPRLKRNFYEKQARIKRVYGYKNKTLLERILETDGIKLIKS